MGKYTGSWQRPIQGVSQQSDKDRIDGQCTLQENLTPSALYGLMKRTGTNFVAQLLSVADDKTLWHQYTRDGGEGYIIAIRPNEYPAVWDMQGNPKVVSPSLTKDAYVLVPDPKKTLRMKTIADYTFIVNTEEDVKARTEKQPDNEDLAIIYCQFATYGRDYIVKIDGVEVAKYTAPDGSSSSHSTKVKTDYVISQLANLVSNSLPFKETVSVISPVPGVYEIVCSNTVIELDSIYNASTSTFPTITNTTNSGGVTRYALSGVATGNSIELVYKKSGTSQYLTEVTGNCMIVRRVDGSPFKAETVDGADGNDLIAVQNKVSQVSNLPPVAPPGYVVKVQNSEGYDANSFWLKAILEEETGSEVNWKETLAPGELLGFSVGTMPVTLVSDGTGFSLIDGEWTDREVGNDDSNPFPSFLDSTIQSLGTAQDRLFFTSGESVVFGQTKEPFGLFRETVQAITDSDPIDITTDADEVNTLLHHAVLDGDLVFFSENGQFLIKGDKPFTAENMVFRKVTSYPVNTVAAPAATGESVMFTFRAGRYAGIREMFTDSYTDTKRATPITEHVREYITGIPTALITSPNISSMLVTTDDDPKVAYVYDWIWQGDQKVQSAFHKWRFGGDILFCKFVKDLLYFVLRRGNGVYLESMAVGSDEDDNSLDFPCRLDMRREVTATWDAVDQCWRWTMPHLIEDNSVAFVLGEDCWEEDKGCSLIFERTGLHYLSRDDLADTTVHTTCKLFAGEKYTSKYTPTQPFMRDQNNRVTSLDRLTIGEVTLNYEALGQIDITVTDVQAKSREWAYEFNGRKMGGWNNLVGFAPQAAGTYSFPVRLPSDRMRFTISTDDYLPFVLRDMEWKGQFQQRGRRA